MAAGRPVVPSDVDGLRAGVQGNGILFAEGNHRQLAEILLRLINNRDEYEKVARACAQAAKDYDISLTVERYNQVYKELCQERR